MNLRDVLEMPGDTMISVKFARELFEGVASPDDAPAMLTVAEFARRISMSGSFVYDNRAELGGIKLGGAIRFPAEAVEEYLRQMQRER